MNKNKICFFLISFLLVHSVFNYRLFANEDFTPVKSSHKSPFSVSLGVDGPVLLLSSSLVFIPLITENEIPYHDPDNLEKSDINAFDRSVIGYQNDTMRIISNISVALVPLTAYGLTFLYNKENSYNEITQDAVIMLESVLVSGALYQLISHSFSRPRPYMYRKDRSGARGNNWDYRSFYSGHTANAMAISTTIAYIHSVRYPNSPYRALVWSVAVIGCTGIGVTRVMAGDHFYSDVIMGMAAGLSVGLLVPSLHRTDHIKEGYVTLGTAPEGLMVTCYF